MTRQRPTVYSTEKGSLCPQCGWPAADCHCAERLEQPIPDRITARIRIEKAGRRGKTVTVLEGLPRNTQFLRSLLGELKRKCATGGTTAEDRIEIQGDHRDRIRDLLAAKGWRVKG
jgi:translation initiation factor 1